MFVFGLMSKTMLVTMPFVLLLLDYWPLERFKVQGLGFRIKNLVKEKIPFFAIAVAASVVTFVVQKHGGAVKTVEYLPLGARVGNALISYCRYLGKMFWPTDLAVLYPHHGYWPLAKVLLAGVFLCGISVLLFMERRRYPFLLVGWLWFVGTLVPVIGFVQVGGQAMADRYTYIPSLGVLALTIWGVYELARGWRHHVIALSFVGSAAIVLCIGLTRQQLGYWKDSETLFRHTLEVTQDNYISHNNLGGALFNKGQTNEAMIQFQEAIRIKSSYAPAHFNLGLILFNQGHTDEAISQYQEAILLKPDDADTHYNLGLALGRIGQTGEAMIQFQEAIRLKLDNSDVHNKLGIALLNKGQTDDAIKQFREVVRLKPDDGEARNNFGVALFKKGQTGEATKQFQEAIRLKPDDAEAHNNLGLALLNEGKTDEAISQCQEAIRLDPNDADAQRNLAMALELKGKSNVR
jgi:tetratricopeptide (TPR) repeat protein